MGTIPVLPTFTAGQILTAADLTEINTVVDFWAAPPRCLVYKDATQSLSSGTTYALVTWPAELYDTDTGHDTVTNNSRVYAKTAGYYRISGLVSTAANATGSRAFMIRQNSAGSSSGGTLILEVIMDAPTNGEGTVPLPNLTIPLAVDDYIEGFAWQNSGGALNLQTGYNNCFLQIELAGKV